MGAPRTHTGVYYIHNRVPTLSGLLDHCSTRCSYKKANLNFVNVTVSSELYFFFCTVNYNVNFYSFKKLQLKKRFFHTINLAISFIFTWKDTVMYPIFKLSHKSIGNHKV